MVASDPEVPARFCYKQTCTGGAKVTIAIHGLTVAEQGKLGLTNGEESGLFPMCDDHFRLFCIDMTRAQR